LGELLSPRRRGSFYVRDCGEFALVADPHPGGIAERGRGCPLMNLLMDEVQLQTDGQTEVSTSGFLSSFVWRPTVELGQRAARASLSSRP
jgi:hypothetical protein